MRKKFIAALMLGFSVTSVSAPAMAGGGDAVAGAIIGGTLGLMLGGAAANSKPARRAAPRRYRSHEEVRYYASIQSRLNYLGYNAGAVDGVMGRRSRAAVSDFQYEAGFPITGRLTDEQVNVLFSPEFEQAHFNPTAPDAPLSVDPIEDDAGFSTVPQSSTASQSSVVPQVIESEPTDDMAGKTGVANAAASKAPLKPLTGANTKLTFSKGKPAFFSIALGQSYDYAKQKLSENGFNDCTGEGEIVTCSSELNEVQRRFKLGRSMSQDGQPIYMMASDTELKVDVEKRVIEQKLGKTYPELMAAPNRVISDNANCALKMARIGDVEDFIDRLEYARLTPDQEPSDALKVTVDMCDVFYKADVAKITGGYDVRVVMFDGTYLQKDFDMLAEKELDKVDKALSF